MSASEVVLMIRWCSMASRADNKSRLVYEMALVVAQDQSPLSSLLVCGAAEQQGSKLVGKITCRQS